MPPPMGAPGMYGAPPAAYGAPGMYGAPPGAYGAPPGAYGAPGMYGTPGMPPPMGAPGMYGTPGPYASQTSAYGTPGMYGAPMPMGAPGMPPPMGAPGMYGAPMPMGAPGMPVAQQTTTVGAGPRGGVVQQQTTTSFAPIVSSCFGRPIQLYNHHGKFLCGGKNNPHGHHNPNHGFNQSSYWFIEPHDGFSDRVRLRNTNGLYLCHVGGTMFCSMHPVASSQDVAWHMEMYPGWNGQNVLFRSYGGHYLSLDKHDSGVHCRSHWGGPHESQRFEIRYC